MSDGKEALKAPVQSDNPHQHVGAAVIYIAAFAFGTFALGTLWGAPWPAAVVACAMSLMGVGVAFIMLRRA